MPDTNASIDRQVEQFTSERFLYENYAVKLKILLIDLLDAHNIKYQVVEARAKEVDSFREKITRAGKVYDNPLADLSDLCGARVIVYYKDDVEKVDAMLASQFSVIERVTIHQQDSLDADRFGYLSSHFVVKLDEKRHNLDEWKFAIKFRAEIQVRTVIQHAWSAVSHALQYKKETAIPSRLRRRLFRIAGLFELADEEFVGIRDAKEQLSNAAAAAFANGNQNIPITSESLIELVADREAMSNVIADAKAIGLGVEDTGDEENAFPEIYEISRRLGLNNIGDIASYLKEDNIEILRAVKNQMGKNWTAPKDFLVFFVLMKRAKNLMSSKELQDFGWGKSVADLIDSLDNSN